MRLLYLYIKEWPERGVSPKSPVEVNFDSEYRFSYENGKLILRGGIKLPDRFFSVIDGAGSKNSTRIESVSAIIGDNGSGKTSIAAIMGRLFKLGQPYPHYIFVYIEGDGLKVYYNLEKGANIGISELAKHHKIQDVTEDERGTGEDYANPFDMVYYSPCLPSEELWGDCRKERFHDVSTGHYLLSDELVKSGGRGEGGGTDKVEAYRVFDKKTMFEFAHTYVNAVEKEKLSDMILPLPSSVQINIHDDSIFYAVDMLPVTKEDQEKEKKKSKNLQVQRISNLVSESHKEILPLRLLAEIIYEYSGSVRYEENGPEFEDQVETALIAMWEQVKEFLASDQDCVCLKLSADFSLFGTNGEDFARLVSKLSVLYKRQKRRGRDGTIYDPKQIDIRDRRDLDDVLDAINEASKLRSGFRGKIDFKLANMSSGEMAYWSLFSRIYKVLPKENLFVVTEGPVRHLLVFIDEAETTMHPEWQRAIVRNLIWFFERFTKGLRVHLVFASHSPMILSDVPKGNVVFLIRGRNDSQPGKDAYSAEVMKAELDRLCNTFGANIYDLYANAYFLKHGPVGAFAKGKIKKLLQRMASRVEGCASDEAEFEALKQIVGDRLVRAYIDKMQAMGFA